MSLVATPIYPVVINELVIVDISNPYSPVGVGEINTNLSGPLSEYVQGRYAYVVNSGNNELVTFDVSNPANPVYVGEVSTNLNNPQFIYVSGRYAYVASSGNNELVTFDLGGSYIQQLQVGGTETGTLQVDGNSTLSGDASIAGGLAVGGGTQLYGGLGVSGQTLIQGISNSTTSFQVANTSGLGLLNANTTNNQVGIGSLATPSNLSATLAAGGSLPQPDYFYFEIKQLMPVADKARRRPLWSVVVLVHLRLPVPATKN